MLKAFISHSSRDKLNYVKPVVDLLNKNHYEYDEETFEGGLPVWDEIKRGLNESQLFVIFISSNSLASEWVKTEINHVLKDLEEGTGPSIYPVIIDEKISYSDDRIPTMLKDQYNIKYCGTPTLVARRIIERLRELSWKRHPKILEMNKIFVGRNDKIEEIEQRVDDFDSLTPIALIASGLKEIGRRTFLKHSLSKLNIKPLSYKPLEILLTEKDSIEDFIIKINDIGICTTNTVNFINTSIEEKVLLARNILKELQKQNEILFIIDNRCIINYKGEIAQWFIDIIDNELDCKITLGIASSNHIRFSQQNSEGKIWFIRINELSPDERKRLLKKYFILEDISTSREDFLFFSNQLKGYPNEVKLCSTMVKELGVNVAKQSSSDLVEFNGQRITSVLEDLKIDINPDFLRFLAESEYFNCSLVTKICGSEAIDIICDLEQVSICEFIGAEKEFVRLSDIVRDYILRKIPKLPTQYNDAIKSHLEETINSSNFENEDSSELMLDIHYALQHNIDVDNKFLIPSHYIKCMKDLYDKRQGYRRIIQLADKVLQKKNNVDDKVIKDIYYFKCLALARLKNKALLAEVQNISGDDHTFLLGFYYRLVGRYDDAIAKFEMIKDSQYVSAKARRELVQIYIQIEDYDKAFSLSKENYKNKPNNEYNIHAYFNCLLNSNEAGHDSSIFDKLINELIDRDTAQSLNMAACAKAQTSYWVNHDKKKAIEFCDNAIAQNTKSEYPYLTKISIALNSNDLELAKETIDAIKSVSSNETHKKYLAYYLAKCGQVREAINIINTEVASNYPDSIKTKILDKIKSYGDDSPKN